MLFRQGTLMRYELKYMADPDSPFQTETQALLLAIQVAQQRQLENCIFYSDCQTLLVQTLEPTRNFRNIKAADWHAYQPLVRIAQICSHTLNIAVKQSCTGLQIVPVHPLA